MGTLIQDFLNNLFRDKDRKSSSTDLIRESWDIEPESPEDYESWTESPGLKNLLSLLKQSYASFKLNEEYHEGVTYMNSDHSMGVAIHIPALRIKLKEALYLAYYFYRILADKQYFKSMSDVRSVNKNENVVSLYRIYLKPSRELRTEKPIQQLFGNIIIETKSINDKLHLFKVQANFYSDSQYADPKGMDELIGLLSD